MTDRFSELLELRPERPGSFIAGPDAGEGFLYGGLTMAVALAATAATVDRPLVPMSMRTAFLSFGTWGAMQAGVEPVHDSRSFANRRVLLQQAEGRRIAAADVTFHAPEEGPEKQYRPAPAVPPPESLGRFDTLTGGLDLMELRPVGPVGAFPSGRIHPYWARVHEDQGDSPAANAAALAFMSDYMVIFSPFEPGHGEARMWRSFTLEHTIWFHAFVHAGEWLLFDAEPLGRAGGRYVTRGTVHDRRERLVASFVQEGFTRPVDPENMDTGRGNP